MAGNDSSREPQKTLIAVHDKVYTNMLRLVFKEGGKVPDNLSGLYKSAAKAKREIDYYNQGLNRPKIYPRTKAFIEKPAVEAEKPPETKPKQVAKVGKETTKAIKKTAKRSVNSNATKTEGIS